MLRRLRRLLPRGQPPRLLPPPSVHRRDAALGPATQRLGPPAHGPDRAIPRPRPGRRDPDAPPTRLSRRTVLHTPRTDSSPAAGGRGSLLFVGDRAVFVHRRVHLRPVRACPRRTGAAARARRGRSADSGDGEVLGADREVVGCGRRLSRNSSAIRAYSARVSPSRRYTGATSLARHCSLRRSHHAATRAPNQVHACATTWKPQPPRS